MRLKHLLLPVIVLAGFLTGPAHASQPEEPQDSLHARIYFRTGYSTLETGYRDNRERLERFGRAVRDLSRDTTATLQRIRIVGSSSPTGRTDLNERLSRKRGETLRNYLQDNLSLPDSLFRLSWWGEDWQGLLGLVEKSDMPSKERAADIIRDTPVWVVKDGKVVDGRKRQLMMLDGGRAWAYMKEYLFPVLQSSAAVECIVERTPAPKLEQAPVSVTEPEPECVDTVVFVRCDTVILRDTVRIVESPVTRARKPFYMALKTNMLYDAALVPNVGAEFYLGRGWTVGANWMYAWWDSDRKSRYWRIYGGELDIRKYFGRRAQQKPLAGHHVGIYGQALTYDFEWGGTGYMGGEPGGDLFDRANWGVGVEYGYSLPVARRLNIDFSIGVGYLGGRYYEYDPADGRYLWKATRNRHWFGPTKAEISLVWLLGRGNYNKEKGGAK